MTKRDAFSGRLGFILAASGAAIGLGNIWRFPFEVADGGGAIFLFVYLFFCFAICMPVMLAEASIGRASRKDVVGSFRVLKSKRWTFVGKIGVLSAVLILSYYNIVAGWAFAYFIEMTQGNFEVGKNFGQMVNNIPQVMFYAFLFMMFTVFVVLKGISKGIERVSRILMPTLLTIIIMLIIYSLTLPNAGKGISFYLVPDISKVSFKVVYKALGQAFFSLSLGLGTIITYGSYLAKNNNLVSSSVFITLSDVFIAFLAGLMMFPLIAFMNQGNMEGVQGGAGLIFQTLPGVFASLGPFWSVFIGSSFFLLLSFAALTSTISLLEVPVSYAVDELKVHRKNAVLVLSLFIFLLGIPSMLSNGDSSFLSAFVTYANSDVPIPFMSFVDHVAGESMLILGGFLITIFTAYAWKKRNMNEEISHGNPGYAQSFLAKYVHVAVCYICPITLGSIFILTILSRFFGLQIF